MKIEQILTELKFANKSHQILCIISTENIKSRIYIVGQVKTNIPGVVLGNREPYLREKNIGTFIDELNTFGSQFKNSDFLIKFHFPINKDTYEFRYYKLTHITLNAEEVILNSNLSELQIFRECHQVPEFE